MGNDLINLRKPKNENWGTGCVIIAEGKVLLGLRSDNKLWGFPGGGVETNETPVDGIIREIFEEVGLSIKPNDLRFIKKTYSYNDNIIWNSFLFVCNYFSGDLKKQKSEIDELRWVPIEELFEYKLFTPTRESIMIILQECPEILYPSNIIEKMTSLEQTIDVKNPGRNGGRGVIDANGNWKYVKPSTSNSNKEPDKKTAPDKSNELNLIKQSYINYYKSKNTFEKIYRVDKNQFIFPEYNLAKHLGIVSDKKSYVQLFKEQFVHYAMFYLNS